MRPADLGSVGGDAGLPGELRGLRLAAEIDALAVRQRDPHHLERVGQRPGLLGGRGRERGDGEEGRGRGAGLRVGLQARLDRPRIAVDLSGLDEAPAKRCGRARAVGAGTQQESLRRRRRRRQGA
ncbi:hypothetical protein mvi_23090 [Methylobacterium indicum]|uniref:Uncharacterized protein n=1 Tax=Methylobacterium indicum TaxID=1775910 RepID=A0A8H8WT81_9HYPH|nr:hypothetical protein mvi_23090 [Methylobacterium indicum]